jgi:ribosomal protein L37AE/L43A
MIGEFRGKRKRESIGDHQSKGHWSAVMDKKRTCMQCAKHKIRRERIYGCAQCGINPCMACFKPYHKEKYPEMFKE